MIVRTMVSLFAALTLSFVAFGDRPAAQEVATPPAPPSLSDLTNIDEFQQIFNEQTGKPRLLLLISPT